MTEEYSICKKNLEEQNIEAMKSENIWSNIDPLKVSNYMWNTNVFSAEHIHVEVDTSKNPVESIYKKNLFIPKIFVPEMHVKMFYTLDGINIFMSVNEKYPRATYHKINNPVYRDSCQEFFLQPCPEEDSRYLNFEFNPWGTYLLGVGINAHDRVIIDEKISLGLFSIKSNIGKINRNDEITYNWSIEFSIPFSFINRFFNTFYPYSGKIMRGNFYKCGDDTIYPHFGSWNEVINEIPDFHRSECFGILTLE